MQSGCDTKNTNSKQLKNVSSNPTNTGITQSSSHKIPISRLKPSSALTSHSSPKRSGLKRTRVEHVVIEKRYRMKITDSLNELKVMLRCTDDKKVCLGLDKIYRNICMLK